MTVHRIAAFAAAIAALVGVSVGLYLSGSPAEQRLLRLDERRVADLGSLARRIDMHLSARGSLPQSLEQLAARARLRAVPSDPATGEPYEYEPIGDERYRLCATFARASREALADDFWQHEAGRQCFALAPPESSRRSRDSGAALD